VNPALPAILGDGPLLLDFDGPVCSIFAGYPAPLVAVELVAQLRAAGIDVPNAVASERDPLEVLRWTGAACGPALTEAVEDALCAAELRAVESAAPTPYGHEVIVAARSAGMAVGVVSNNSPGAVAAYLTRRGLAGCIAPIVGRAYADPPRMKPNPAPILDAIRSLGADPAACVLVGDSLSDIEGARAAGVRVIGYANRPAKIEAFRGADAVITTMGDLAVALSPSSVSGIE
jgi:HAD superfamily hydrolase (TIGR01509 family)